ncbi:MAG: type II secretion system major pseudopilin GspG [Planctomycetaceae bacterium]|nr:type II secretion system major pseudopilin GspG [Planctomycetaceae bacterium]
MIHDQNKHTRRCGFTLVELMGVIVILGLLAGVMTIGIRRYMLKSRQNVAKVEIATLCQAIESFHSENGRYPTSEEGLSVLLGNAGDPDGYISGKAIGKDPWGNQYDYISPGSSSPYLVVSYGADGREGGTGANQDLTSDELGADR